MLRIENLNITFGDQIIFNDFSLNIKTGEKIAITGKSGKGKSTLLNLIAGFIPNYTGKIFVNGISFKHNNINEIRNLIAWLPQETALNLKTVNELFYAPFHFTLNKNKRPNKQQIDEIFNIFELPNNLLLKNNKDISGGQRQRIVLASCLLLNKSLLLIDEPTSALDESIKRKVTDFILNKNNLTVLAATHDNYWINNSDAEINLK
jgi:ABC-type bacteriocin/lantibiotic exporter with double-glycine peptidase domain